MSESQPTPAAKPAPTEPSTSKRRIGCLGRIAVILVSLLFSILLAEVLVRLFGDEVLPNALGPRYMYVADDVIGIRIKPGFRGDFTAFGEFNVPVEINSRGFRDREFGDKATGVTRILSLGDSFGFGYGVSSEECYAKQLEDNLNKGRRKDRKFEVLNAGVSGEGILHMIENLKRTRDWFKPDIVVVSFFYVNDLMDMEHFPEHTVRGGVVLHRGIAHTVDHSRWLRFGFHYSNLVLLAERARIELLTKLDLTDLPPLPTVWGSELLVRDHTKPDDARTRLWSEFETHLATLAKETAAAGAKLVLFSIPQDYQTRDEIWEKRKSQGLVDDERYDRFLVGKKLTGICERTGVHFLDLVPAFRATPPTESRFFPRNKHFNQEGHAYAAKLIEKFLREKGVL